MRIPLLESLPRCFCLARWDPSSLVAAALSLGYLLVSDAWGGGENLGGSELLQLEA